MSETVERRVREVAAEFPRPDGDVTRRVERELRARVKASTRTRRFAPFAVTAVLALAAGVGLGAGVVAAVAATDRVTLTVRPQIIGFGTTPTLFGSVSNGRARETVTFEIRECGQTRYREFAGATTADGGAYSTGTYQILINASVRARWGGAVSEEVEVKRRAAPTLRRLAGGRFRVWLFALRRFEGKRVRVERWDRAARRWIGIRQVTLEHEGGDLYPIGGSGSVASGKELRLRVRRGTTLRAVFTDAQAAPCYLGGVSRIVTS